jgi:hypothetical protein
MVRSSSEYLLLKITANQETEFENGAMHKPFKS